MSAVTLSFVPGINHDFIVRDIGVTHNGTHRTKNQGLNRPPKSKQVEFLWSFLLREVDHEFQEMSDAGFGTVRQEMG